MPISRPNFVELCERLVVEDEEIFESLWRTLGLSVDWKEHYTTIGPKAQTVSQRAFLRNFARGEAYLQEAPTLWDVTFQTAVAQAELEAREYAGAYHRVAFHRPDGEPGPHRDHPPGADPQRRGADRAPRRRALPAAVRHHGHLARLRRGDPGPRPPARRDGQGRGHRDVLHVRRPDRRHLVARAGAAGPHADRPRRPTLPGDPRLAQRRGGLRRRTSSSPARPPSPRREAMVALLRESGDLDGDPTPTQRMANFYEKGDKPLEIVATRQWYIRNGGRDAALRQEMLDRGAEVTWVPTHMKHRYDNWVGGLNGDWLISRQRFFGIPFPVWYPLDADGEPDYDHPLLPTRGRAAGRPVDRRAARLHRGPARQAGRLRRRPRRDGHLGHLVADPADRRRLGERRRPVRSGSSRWTCARTPTTSSAPGCSPASSARTSRTASRPGRTR